MRPELGASNPVSIFMVVDLPAPWAEKAKELSRRYV